MHRLPAILFVLGAMTACSGDRAAETAAQLCSVEVMGKSDDSTPISVSLDELIENATPHPNEQWWTFGTVTFNPGFAEERVDEFECHVEISTQGEPRVLLFRFGR